MTQFNDRVEKQRLKIEAEEWANGVKSIHAHSLTSLWYDKGREDGSVLDVQYNDGRVKRENTSTGETIILGTQLVGDALLEQYVRESN